MRRNAKRFDVLFADEIKEKINSDNATPTERFLYDRLVRVADTAAFRETKYHQDLGKLEERIKQLTTELNVERGVSPEKSARYYTTTVGELPLPARTMIAMTHPYPPLFENKKGSDTTVQDLREITEEKLRPLRGVGDGGIRYIRTALGKLGTGLKNEPPQPFPSGAELYDQPLTLIVSTKASNELRKMLRK